MKKAVGILLSTIGVSSFFVIGYLTDQRETIYSNFVYQVGVLLVSISIIFLFNKNYGSKFFKIGKLNAQATPFKLFGISKNDNWRSIGLTFSFIITFVTGLVIYFTNQELINNAGVIVLFFAFLIALPLSILNSFNEEVITRWTIVEAFGEKSKTAPYVSGLIFGIPHFFGVPGGILGTVLSFILGVLLAKSIQDTKGIGWAVFIHMLQDIVIFTTLLIPLI
jgi:hypothetical protein